MHRWDRRLRPPQGGVRPVAWPGSHAGQPAPVSAWELRGPGWRRTSRGLYVPAEVERTDAQRIIEAASRLPEEGAVGGWAAAYWGGVRLLDGRGAGTTPRPVPLYIGTRSRLRPAAGVTLSYERLAPDDVARSRGLRVTGPLRTLFDGARMADTLVEAVVFVDMILASGLVTREQATDYVAAHGKGWRGTAQARRAIELADPATRSPMETRFRMVWMLVAMLPRPLVNPPVFGPAGEFLGIPDLLDPDAGVAAEFDGRDHQELEARTADDTRHERLQDHGLVVTRATSLHLRAPHQLATRLRRAWNRGRGRDRTKDTWTLEAPGGWTESCQLVTRRGPDPDHP